jgi:hypothetical protein
MRRRLEKRRIDLVARLDMLFRHDRPTGSDTPDERQTHLLAHRVHEPNAAGRAGHQRNDAFASKRAQVLFRSVCRLEAELARDFHARWRHAGIADEALNEAKNLGLARCQV